MISVHPATSPASAVRGDDPGEQIVESPVAPAAAVRAPAHAAPRPVPSARRLRLEKLAVVAVFAVLLVITLAILAMQWLHAAPTTVA